MQEIKLEKVLDLERGMIIVAVFSNGRQEAFFTEGLPNFCDSSLKRKKQLDAFSEAEKFLYPTRKEITELLNNALMDAS